MIHYAKAAQAVGQNCSQLKGFLFEDQLKQVNSINSQGNPDLYGIDINNYKDIESFARLTESDIRSFSPATMVKVILTRGEELQAVSNLSLNAGGLANKQLYFLSLIISKLQDSKERKYLNEILLLEKIVNDLALRLYEAINCNYTPEINWVSKATMTLFTFASKFNNDEPITPKLIRKTMGYLFNCRVDCYTAMPFVNIKPNSQVEKLIWLFLAQASKQSIINELRIECVQYKGYILSKLKKSPKNFAIIEKVNIIDELEMALNNLDISSALNNFQMVLEDNKKLFAERRLGGFSFYVGVVDMLSRVPLIRLAFKVEGENLVGKLYAIKAKHPVFAILKSNNRVTLKVQRLRPVERVLVL